MEQTEAIDAVPLVVALEEAIEKRERENNNGRRIKRFVRSSYSSYYPARDFEGAKEDVVRSFEELVKNLVRFGFEFALSRWRP